MFIDGHNNDADQRSIVMSLPRRGLGWSGVRRLGRTTSCQRRETNVLSPCEEGGNHVFTTQGLSASMSPDRSIGPNVEIHTLFGCFLLNYSVLEFSPFLLQIMLNLGLRFKLRRSPILRVYYRPT